MKGWSTDARRGAFRATVWVGVAAVGWLAGTIGGSLVWLFSG